MSLGLIAKDSIQDLASLVNGAGDDITKSPRTQLLYHRRGGNDKNDKDEMILSTTTTATMKVGSEAGILLNPIFPVMGNDTRQGKINGNPQQAPIAITNSITTTTAPNTTDPVQFRYDMSDYTTYYYEYERQQEQIQQQHQLAAARSSFRRNGSTNNNNMKYPNLLTSSDFASSNDNDNAGDIFLIGQRGNENKNMWCCLFPWMAPVDNKSRLPMEITQPFNAEIHQSTISTVDGIDFVSEQYQQGQSKNGATSLDKNALGRVTFAQSDSVPSQVVSDDEGDDNDGTDSCSTSSTAKRLLGEKLSERDRQALLARLRLAQPETSILLTRETEKLPSTIATDSMDGATRSVNNNSPKNSKQQRSLVGFDINDSISSKNSLLNGITVPSTLDGTLNKPLRSILKLRSIQSRMNDPIMIMKNGVILSDGVVVPNNINSSTSSGSSGTEDSIVGTDQQPNDDNPALTLSSMKPRQQKPAPPRRSLFPVAYERNSRYSSFDGSTDSFNKKKENHRVRFAPMARVVAVTSKNDMSEEEKSDIWWQRSDYEDFRRTGRIITRAMLEGGSEIWLSSATPKSNEQHTSSNATSVGSTKTSTNSTSSGTSLSKRPSATLLTTTKNFRNQRDGISSDEDNDSITTNAERRQQQHDQELMLKLKNKADDENKWWHKFGHSRRGLEHVVSTDEGRQRQLNVKSAIRAVLDEQMRQIKYKRTANVSMTGGLVSASVVPSTGPGHDERLRQVSMHHTHWARDLALAAGASDADAVESRFAADRRSREFYLLKLARYTSGTATLSSSSSSSLLASTSSGNNRSTTPFSNPQHHLVPQFMQPVFQAAAASNNSLSGGVGKLQLQQRLDANTAAQIRFRRSTTSSIPATAVGAGRPLSTIPARASLTMPKVTPNDSIAKDSLNVKTGVKLLQQMKEAKTKAITTSIASIDEDTVIADSIVTNIDQTHQVDQDIQPLPIVKIGDVTVQPLNDPSCDIVDEKSQQQQSSGQQPPRNLAQQAAGYMPSDSKSNSTEKVNMSAVLSGMGLQ